MRGSSSQISSSLSPTTFWKKRHKRFTEQNQTNLSQLLTPLADRSKVSSRRWKRCTCRRARIARRSREQVKLLMGLNQQLSDDTGNLTRALTTSAKAQGDLGEMILEKILESLGLRKDEEYFVQNSFRTSRTSRQARPDVIVKLPENKHLIIDSKVSLTAYNEYVNAETDEARKLALARHMESVRRHIKELAEKNYQSLHQLQSIDFVCMFVPSRARSWPRSATTASFGQATSIAAYCCESEHAAVCGAHGGASVASGAAETERGGHRESRRRTVRQAGGLCGRSEDVGDRLEQAKSSYGLALGKLSTGKGNVIRQAEMLKAWA